MYQSSNMSCFLLYNTLQGFPFMLVTRGIYPSKDPTCIVTVTANVATCHKPNQDTAIQDRTVYSRNGKL